MPIDIRDHGATADGSPQTQAIQAAIDAAGPSGGCITVPAGVWPTGTLWLRDGVKLHLERGAVLKGTNRPDDYPYRDLIAEGAAVSRRVGPRRMIGAVGCRDVAVTGHGTIDGDGGCGGQIQGPYGNEGHPQNLQLVDCTGVTVQDVRLRNAGSWMQQYHACTQVHISGISVWNHGNPTNDGLDIDGCADVIVSDCDIDSHDDALVFKSTGPSPCRDILVTNCRLRSNCHGIKFGTESVGGFERIRVSNCIVSPSRDPSPMPNYPEGRPVITGCALECTDGGVMRQIHIDGLIAHRVFAPIFITLGNRLDRRIEETDPPAAGVVEDITIRNVHATSAGPHACPIHGYPGHPVRRVRLSDITIEQVGGLGEDAVLNDVPDRSDAYPEINMLIKKTDRHLPAYGFYLRDVEDASLRGIRLKLQQPDARRAVVAERVDGLSIADCVDAEGQAISAK